MHAQHIQVPSGHSNFRRWPSWLEQQEQQQLWTCQTKAETRL